MEVSSYLLVICFPVSVWLWCVILLGAGKVHDLNAMPWEFRAAARIAGMQKAVASSDVNVFGVAVLLAFVNLPLFALLVGPYGLIGPVALAVYAAAMAGWLIRIRRALARQSA